MQEQPKDAQEFLIAFSQFDAWNGIRFSPRSTHFLVPKLLKAAAWRIASRTLLVGLPKKTDNRVEIRSHVLQAMMAARDKISILLSNSLFLLSHDLIVYEKLQKEALLLELDSLTSLFDNLRSLKYVSSIY